MNVCSLREQTHVKREEGHGGYGSNNQTAVVQFQCQGGIWFICWLFMCDEVIFCIVFVALPHDAHEEVEKSSHGWPTLRWNVPKSKSKKSRILSESGD